MIVRHTSVIICNKNLVGHRDGLETMRGGIIFWGSVGKKGKIWNRRFFGGASLPTLAPGKRRKDGAPGHLPR
jgi:hypothetical protein